MILTDAQIEAQYEGFKVVGFKYDRNRYSEGFSGVIEIEFPNADHEDFVMNNNTYDYEDKSSI